MNTTQTPEAQNLINAAAKASEVFTPDELEAALPPRSPGPLVSLTCCCCGTGTKGRQWWNRDTGYGLCDSCIASNGVAGVPMGGTAQGFGVRSVHWGIDTRPAIMNAKLNKRERRAAALLAHYATCERLALALGVIRPDGKRISVRLFHLEQSARKAATAYCNGEPFYFPGDVEKYDFRADGIAWDKVKERITGSMRVTFAGKMPPGFFVNGDARGYALKIDPDNAGGRALIESCRLHTDWGRNGILSPEITGD